MDRPGHPDRLVSGAEAVVTADLQRHRRPQLAEPGQVLALGRFCQLPPQVQLGLPILGDPAALDDQRRRAEVADQVVALGGDVALVEIDDQRLHLPDMLGAGLAVVSDRAGDHIDRTADRSGGLCRGGHDLGRPRVCRDPAQVVRRPRRHALLGQAAQRDQAVAPGKDHVDKQRDLVAIDAGRAHCSRPSPGARSAGWT